MLFSIGTRVSFQHSKDTGVVTALLDNGMVNVLLDEDNMEIPAFTDDLIRLEESLDSLSSVRAKILPGKQKKKPEKPKPSEIESQYTILKSRGIQLAFDPVEQKAGSAEHYQIFLLNDTPFDVLYSYQMDFRNTTNRQQTGKLASLSFLKMGNLLFDQLNDAPNVRIECWRVTTEGTGKRLERNLRIKPKQFFKRVATAPLLNRPVHLFKVFDELPSAGEKKSEEDLRTYTKRRAQHLGKFENIRRHSPNDIIERATFVPEIDLHVEKLTTRSQKMSNTEIIRLQISHFEAYIDRAVRLGVDRVFIIHGVGKGRLRDTIASRLIGIPEVETFKNEYHPRYGWGATEVIFA